jgi:hypothetical protein
MEPPPFPTDLPRVAEPPVRDPELGVDAAMATVVPIEPLVTSPLCGNGEYPPPAPDWSSFASSAEPTWVGSNEDEVVFDAAGWDPGRAAAPHPDDVAGFDPRQALRKEYE